MPVVGAAGATLAFAGSASAATAPTAHGLVQDITSRPLITLAEEEISDINLGTFYVFDQENVEFGEPVKVARRGCGGCGCRGCGGCAARAIGCGGCGGCGCRGCAVRFRAVGCAGCGGCGCGCATGCRLWIGGFWVWVC